MNSEHPVTIEFSIPNQLGYEKLARHTLAWLGPRLGLDSARLADVQTAVSEACINAIEHGNQSAVGRRVHVVFSYAHDHLDAVIADEGMNRYEASDSGPATIEQKIAGLAPARGMGLFLISQLVDEAGFLPPSTEHGNRYWLRIYRTTQRSTISTRKTEMLGVAYA